MKSVNQKRGPTTGNAGNASKREAFKSAKAAAGNERSSIVNMVMGALETRGRGMKTQRQASTEPVAANVNVGKRKK